MSNTNTNNIYAETIAENRYIASAQLSADDMSAKTWKQYRQLCDNIAIAAWRSLHKSADKDDNTLGLSLTGLFAFFGSDAKATMPMQKRFVLACVAVKKEQSVAMKAARKVLRNAKIALDEAVEAEKDEATIATLTEAVETAQAEVERLESEPMNVWYQKTPMLDSTRKHANAKCRKLIEDTIADIMAERELMTVEELQAEALALKAERKARKQMKAQANANAEAVEAVEA